jgi:hypothetical protein
MFFSPAAGDQSHDGKRDKLAFVPSGHDGRAPGRLGLHV